MPNLLDVQRVTDSDGATTAVVVPIGAWNEIVSELESTGYLGTPAMRRRIEASLNTKESISAEEVFTRLGI